MTFALSGVLLLAVAGVALAASKPPSPSPVLRLITPRNHARLGAGHALTFRVRDTDPRAHRYPPYVNVSNQRASGGVLAVHTTATGGTFLRLNRAKRGVFSVPVQMFSFAGFWLRTPGRYYVQVRQYDPTVPGSFLYSRVATIWVR